MFSSRNDDTWSIVRIAQEAGLSLQLKVKGNPQKGYKTNCPICGDTKGNLELQGDRDVFHCWVCQAEGGVIRFYSLLHNMSEQSAKEQLREESCKRRGIDTTIQYRKNVRRHPAENLSLSELRGLGFVGKYPNWYELKKNDPQRARALADWIWNEKKAQERSLNRIRRAFLNAEKQVGAVQNVKSNYSDRAINPGPEFELYP